MAHRRSPLLKSVDEALLRYERSPNESNLMALGYALAAWKESKPDFLTSVRNRKGAVYRLVLEVTENPTWVAQDRMLTEAERTNLRMLFAGKQIQTTASRLRMLKSAATTALMADYNAGEIAGGASNTAQAAPISLPMTNKIIGACFGDIGGGGLSATQVVTDVLGPDFVTSFSRNVVPFLGLIKSGVDVVGFWYDVAKRRYDRYNVEHGRDAVRPGDAAAALEAIRRILIREQNENVRRGVMQSVEFTVRVAAPPGVGSIASGVNGLGQLAETIFQIGRDYREKSAVNPILRGQGKLDASVFNISPLLGCYLMACSTRSNVLHVLFDEIGQNGWMTEVERLNKQMGPIVESARRIIGEARFTIPNMPLIPLMRQPGNKYHAENFARRRSYAQAGRFHRLFLQKPPPSTSMGSASGQA